MSSGGLEIVNNAADCYTNKRAARQPRRTGPSRPGRHVDSLSVSQNNDACQLDTYESMIRYLTYRLMSSHKVMYSRLHRALRGEKDRCFCSMIAMIYNYERLQVRVVHGSGLTNIQKSPGQTNTRSCQLYPVPIY